LCSNHKNYRSWPKVILVAKNFLKEFELAFFEGLRIKVYFEP